LTLPSRLASEEVKGLTDGLAGVAAPSARRDESAGPRTSSCRRRPVAAAASLRFASSRVDVLKRGIMEIYPID
jgi:hypothetical protein